MQGRLNFVKLNIICIYIVFWLLLIESVGRRKELTEFKNFCVYKEYYRLFVVIIKKLRLYRKES